MSSTKLIYVVEGLFNLFQKLLQRQSQKTVFCPYNWVCGVWTIFFKLLKNLDKISKKVKSWSKKLEVKSIAIKNFYT